MRNPRTTSLLLSGRQVRLAPLYDIASALPYDRLDPHRMKLAMRIGRRYEMRETLGRHWQSWAGDAGLDPGAVLDRARTLAEDLPGALSQACAAPEVTALGSSLPTRLLSRVRGHAARCAHLLG